VGVSRPRQRAGLIRTCDVGSSTGRGFFFLPPPGVFFFPRPLTSGVSGRLSAASAYWAFIPLPALVCPLPAFSCCRPAPPFLLHPGAYYFVGFPDEIISPAVMWGVGTFFFLPASCHVTFNRPCRCFFSVRYSDDFFGLSFGLVAPPIGSLSVYQTSHVQF